MTDPVTPATSAVPATPAAPTMSAVAATAGGVPPVGEEDSLIAELNGSEELPPLIDDAPDAAPSRASELTILPADSAPSAVKVADAVHSTKAGGKGYSIIVKGTYFALHSSGKGKVLKPYEAEFKLPELEAALSIIKNKLLKPKLRKMFPDFVAVQLKKIVSTRPLSPETPETRNLAYMGRPQLEAHIKSIRAPINYANYQDVTELRDAIIDFTQTPNGFEKREAKRMEDRKVDNELAALNDDIDLNS